MRFHRRCGDRVTLLNDNSTAIRNFVEFNHGLILSAEPIVDNVIFEVCIDRKVTLWNGSLEIGVTTLDPDFMELPATATKLRNTAWILSGSSIVKDGVTIVHEYGPELDTLREGDCIGVVRTSKGELMFYINGRCMGVAARDLPPKLFAVIDMYGQCVQVTILPSHGIRDMETSLDQIEDNLNNIDSMTSSEMEAAALPTNGNYLVESDLDLDLSMSQGACALVPDKIRFHPRCGILVKLSGGNKTAERARPLDDYNNGVVMTHRPLRDNELFEIRIDRLVDKWSGSIEVGVTTHNPSAIRFPSTMTNMDTGTIMMSGCKVLLNGHGTCKEYGNFNLDELREGNTVGMMRKSNGNLHYYINGVDQGVATDKVDPQVWGVIDLYGMTVKVTIVDPCEVIDSNIHVPMLDSVHEISPTHRCAPKIDEDSLLFHKLRDSHVFVINNGKTAHRPNAFDYFTNTIVMTNRTLKTNELFQVRLDSIVSKWAGSIEIGVTQHSCNDIHFPFKLSNAKTGTWVMTGEDVIRDSSVVIPQYVRNLSRLAEGDTVGVMRKDMGILHFFVNGVDQGPASFNVPEHVFGAIDLYGRVAQITVVDNYIPPPVYSPESPQSVESNATVYPDMCFHRVHGHNIRLSRNRLTASRSSVHSEFNQAVLFSCRPLRECEMFEIRIDKMVDSWIGSLEIGVTTLKPEDLETNSTGVIAGTATDLLGDTHILSGSAIMRNGECITSGYVLDLDSLTVGSRVGVMWHADRSLHYYLDGVDQGRASIVPHLVVYAVADLYGQCTQVTILQNEERGFNYNGCNSDNSFVCYYTKAMMSSPPPYCFSEYCGDNVCLMREYSVATRLTSDPSDALLFSAAHLAVGELFEIKILECKSEYAGTIRIGVTDINILNAHVNRSLPPSISYLPHYTAYIDGRYLRYSKPITGKWTNVHSVVPSFEWLKSNDRIGLKKTSDSKVFIYYNSEQLDAVIENVPDKVYVVIELYGMHTSVQAISKLINVTAPILQPAEIIVDEKEKQPLTTSVTSTSNVVICSTTNISSLSNVTPTTPMSALPQTKRKRPLPYTFHHIHGDKIKLCSSDTVALRDGGYTDGVAIVSQPLRRGHNFMFRVDRMSGNWAGTVSVGAINTLHGLLVPDTALGFKEPCWILGHDFQNINGETFHTNVGAALKDLKEQSVITLHFKFSNELLLILDNNIVANIGTISRQYSFVYPLIDLYGKLRQVSILLHPYVLAVSTSIDLPIIKEQAEDDLNGEDVDPEFFIANWERVKAQSEENLLEETEAVAAERYETANNTKDRKYLIKKYQALHHSLMLSSHTPPYDSTAMFRSQSYNFNRANKEIPDKSTRASTSLADDGNCSSQCLCDTNIQDNDQYPETNEFDEDNMNTITLDTANAPDLRDEPCSSYEPNLTIDTVLIDNVHYLKYILCSEPEGDGCESLESAWEATGARCERLRLVYKYWNYFVSPFPELRAAMSPENVHCYCANCEPSASSYVAGWVRLEAASDSSRGTGDLVYWHIERALLVAAPTTPAEREARRKPPRPHVLHAMPKQMPHNADVWIDEEGKPHQTAIALEINVKDEDDKLMAIMIYLRPCSVFTEEGQSQA